MRVTLLGIGDMTGMPAVGCDCETCLTARERGIERTHFSIRVQNERTGESLLVDFSPGFRHQFLTQDVSLPDEALVIRIHFDHLDDPGDVYHLLDNLSVRAANEADPVTGESVADATRSKLDYLDRILVEDRTPSESSRACGPDVTFVPVVHPPLVCYGVAIEDPETGAKLSLSGDMACTILEASRDMFRDPDLLLAEATVPASVCEYHPIGGDDYDEDGVARTFGTKHMTCEGVIALGEELNTDETRLVHVVHYYPADEAFKEPLAVDSEVYDL